jgi:hypothetical protein
MNFIKIQIRGLMAEWFKRGTVNTFYRGSNPLKTLKWLIKF